MYCTLYTSTTKLWEFFDWLVDLISHFVCYIIDFFLISSNNKPLPSRILFSWSWFGIFDQPLIVCFENIKVAFVFLACFFTVRKDLAWHTNTIHLAKNIRKLPGSNRVRNQWMLKVNHPDFRRLYACITIPFN